MANQRRPLARGVIDVFKGTVADSDGSDGDLSVPFHTRISPAAEQILRQRARASGLRPATWARIELYKILGLIKDAR